MKKLELYFILLVVAFILLGCGNINSSGPRARKNKNNCTETTGNDISCNEIILPNEEERSLEMRVSQTAEMMIAFLYDNQEKMEQLADELIKAFETGQRLQYYPADNELLVFESYKQGYQLKEHRIFDVAKFIAGNDIYNFVVPKKSSSDNSTSLCKFITVIKDESGEDMYFIELIYCPNTLDEEEKTLLKEVCANWYIYGKANRPIHGKWDTGAASYPS